MKIFKPKDLAAKVMELSITGGLPKGLSTGWIRMDEIWSVRLGELTVVTGIPNHGKSEFMDALMVNLAMTHRFHWAIFSPENHPLEVHLSKLLEKVTRIPFSKGPTREMELEDIEDGIKCMNDYFAFIKPDPEDLTLESILNLAGEYLATVSEEHPCGVLIDPWNELDHRRPASLTESEYISQTLSRVRYWARDINAHVFIVAHPTKLYREKDGTYPIPTLYDISGSANWRNKADNGLIVHRPNIMQNPNHTEVYVQKVRFRHVGRPGKVEFNFNPVNGTFDDVAPLHPRLR